MRGISMGNDSVKIDDSVRGVLKRAALWCIICGVTAIPSLTWANMAKGFDLDGMVVGVLLFAVMYTVVTGTPGVARFRASRLRNRTLRIGYFTRVVVSAIVPLGMALDVIPGMISVLIVDSASGRMPLRGGETHGFFSTLAITLIQGAFLHVTLGVYMLIVHLIQWWWVGKEYPEGHCQNCGYDLRASYEFGRCPECGAPCGPGVEGSPNVAPAVVSETTPGEARTDVGDDPETPAR